MDNLEIGEDMAFLKVLQEQFNSFLDSLGDVLNERFKDVTGVRKCRVLHGDSNHAWTECLSEGISYSAPLNVEIATADTKKRLHLCNIPLLTPRGTFIIEGQERIAKKILKATDIGEDKNKKKHLSAGEKTRDLRFFEVKVIDFYKILLRWLNHSLEKEGDFYKIILGRLIKGEADSVSVKEQAFENFFGGADIFLSIFNSKTGIEQFPFLDSTNPLSEVEHMRKLTFIRGERTRDGRDIHPTHYGRLCIVETPESEKIGMRLHLAHKARIEDGKILSPIKNLKDSQIEYLRPEEEGFIADSLTELKGKVLVRGVDANHGTDDGKYVDASDVIYTDAFDDQLFGYAALQVPFIQHNDPARSLMGAKNLKQAVPLKDPEIPIVKTGYEETVAQLSGRIIRAAKSGKIIAVNAHEIVVSSANEDTRYSCIKGVPSVLSKTALFQIPTVKENDNVEAGQIIASGACIKDGSLALGVNALCAYMPFFGYNMDDGLVISDEFAEKLTSVHIEEFEIKIKPGDIPSWIATEGMKLQLFPNGIRFKELPDRGGLTRTPIAVIKRMEDRKTEEITIFAKEAMLGGIVRKSFLETDRIRFWVQRDMKLEVGDKLMGRHGNKGIVAKIFPQKDMPFFEIDIEGKKERRHLDMLFNPHSVITRMNIGQIYETHLGWIAREHPDGKIRSDAGMLGKPFSNVDMEVLSQWFGQSGLDPHGKINVRFADGHKTANPVVVGYQYIVKLNHLASSKLSIRGETGPVSFVTDLPLAGKKRVGGQRFGEMEVWALLAHGAHEILRDMLGHKANAHLLATGAVSVSESLKALVYYLRGLGIALDILDQRENSIDAEDFENIKRSEIRKYSVRWANSSEMTSWGRYRRVPEKKATESLKEYWERKKTETGVINGAKNILNLNDLEPEYKEQMGYIRLAENVSLCDRDIDVLPVIPVRCRPQASNRLSTLYKRIFCTNNELIELKRAERTGTDDYKKKKCSLQQKVQRLENELQGLIKGKNGIIRKAILGKRVNFSARAVIVPDPTLPADSAMIPKKIMNELQIKDPVVVRTKDGEKTKHQRVLLNRQPTLHIHSIQAFNALPSGDNAIAINPLICGGFNADFDGDTMAVYVTDKPVPEGMLAHENIFLAANGKLNLNFSQDIIAGIYYASGSEEGKKEFGKLIDDKDLFDAEKAPGFIGKDAVSSIVHGHFLKNNNRLSTLRFAERIEKFGLQWATLSGLTFGIFDLHELSVDQVQKKAADYSADAIETILKERITDEANLANPISIMMLSGARGDVKQLRQMAGVKGIVDRLGGGTTAVSVSASYFEGLKPTEYYLASFGARNSLGDKKLMTPQCGYLTRRLVFAAFDMAISEDDCGTGEGFTLGIDCSLGRTLLKDIHLNSTIIQKDSIIDEAIQQKLSDHDITGVEVRSPLTCKSAKGICGKCYGWHLSRREAPKAGFAAGIMSAELIGERATQDAMRTYHKGTATGTIKLFDETRAIFDNSKDKKTGKKVSEDIKNVQDVINLARTLFENYEKKVDLKHYEVMLKALMFDETIKGTKEVISKKGLLYNASFERAVEVFMEHADGEDACTARNALDKMFT